ncbi:DUF6233 domain-containing protein [Streptomyces sp. NPDC057445]|uniref:DUF6233 domain-containing protein n=1 Tax=Streptomyces sp. NPDC057445 TaxID=3346136 RepID=UPI0036BA4793
MLRARVQTQRAWMYQVGLPAWQARKDGWVQPAEHVVWVPGDYVRLLEGVPYEGVPTQELVSADAAAPATEAGVWRTQRLPFERGRPGWNVVHVHDCKDADDGDILDRDQALTAARQPGTRLCTTCEAAETLQPLL